MTNEKGDIQKAKSFKVKVDNAILEFRTSCITGEELLMKAGRLPVECFSLYEKIKGCDFEKIRLHEEIDLSRPGIEHFVTKPPDVFHYKVDDEPETTEENQLTANQILEAAGYNAADYYLVQINDDGTQISYENDPEKSIQMKCPGLKFIALYRSSTPVS